MVLSATLPIPVVDPVWRSRIISYVQDRRCHGGGYCFYRLDEPNAGDTYHALRILSLLGEGVQDGESAGFLQGLQQSDGSYVSYPAALYAGLGLRILGSAPLHDVGGYLARHIPSPDPAGQNVETFSLFDPLLIWVSLSRLHGVEPQGPVRHQILGSILGFRTATGGFGSPNATLPDTWQAAEVLAMLEAPLPEDGIARFLRSCEDPGSGFLGQPSVRPAYLEHLYAGLRLAALLEIAPRYSAACRRFLEECAHLSGGFVRSVFGGAPTLEFTALAVESLTILAGGVAPPSFVRGRSHVPPMTTPTRNER